jgi:hypothetical protein
LWAAHWNDLQDAELLVRAGADANAANDFRMTPLSQACTNGSAAFVNVLLKAGAHPDTPIATGETPLMTCARAGAADAVRALLVRGADVNATEPTQHQTALMWAAAEQHPNVLQTLIDARADLARTRNQDSPRCTLPRAPATWSRFERSWTPASTSTIRSRPILNPVEEQGERPRARGGAARGPRESASVEARAFPAARRCSSPLSAATSRSRCSCSSAARIPTSRCRIYSPSLGSGHVGKRSGQSGLRDSSIRSAVFRIVKPNCNSSRRSWRTARTRIFK